MPELEPQARPAAATATTPPDPDPLARLHKMSTTAGVGSQEYVAINNIAVTAGLLGLATALAFLGNIFLVVGAAAIVCGLIAIRQINDSNGTQGGRWIAVLGILAALAFAGMVGAREFARARREGALTREINTTIQRFGDHLMAARYGEAYALFDDAFRSIVTPEQFEQTFKFQQSPEFYGPITSMRGNDIVDFNTQDGRLTGSTQAIVRYTNQKDDMRMTLILVREPGGQWRINRIMELFQAQFNRRGGAAKPPSASPAPAPGPGVQ